MRKPNTKNQERRARKRERKAAEKKEKDEEMKRLMNTKKSQILERLKHIETVSGAKSTSSVVAHI